jgi:hypothetical protein
MAVSALLVFAGVAVVRWSSPPAARTAPAAVTETARARDRRIA